MNFKFGNFRIIEESAYLDLKRRAETDKLTGLLNFDQIHERYRYLCREVRKGNHFAVIVLDLNHLKPINDNYGHQAGDTALRIVGGRLLGAFRQDQSYFAGRTGGDEFVVLLPNVLNIRDSLALSKDQIPKDMLTVYAVFGLVDRLMDKFNEPVRKEIPLPVTVSIGVAFSSGQDNPSKTLSSADEAMYRAKRRNPNETSVEYCPFQAPQLIQGGKDG